MQLQGGRCRVWGEGCLCKVQTTQAASSKSSVRCWLLVSRLREVGHVLRIQGTMPAQPGSTQANRHLRQGLQTLRPQSFQCDSDAQVLGLRVIVP